jgi:hypothetical protein
MSENAESLKNIPFNFVKDSREYFEIHGTVLFFNMQSSNLIHYYMDMCWSSCIMGSRYNFVPNVFGFTENFHLRRKKRPTKLYWGALWCRPILSLGQGRGSCLLDSRFRWVLYRSWFWKKLLVLVLLNFIFWVCHFIDPPVGFWEWFLGFSELSALETSWKACNLVPCKTKFSFIFIALN